MYQKSQSYDVWFLRYGVQQTEFFVITDRFFGPRKSKFWKNEKNTWRYDHFTNVYHKWQSYDIWFFRYGVQKTKFFVILDLFLLFYPLNNLKNQNFDKLKKVSGDIIILHMCTKNYDHIMYGSYDRYGAWDVIAISHFELFFALLPH